MDKKRIMKIVVIVAVMCIPVMYSFFYLKSYWDPYSKLEEMTIAMVNLDEGGENGENLGQDFIDNLVEEDVVTIKQVDYEEAQKGLAEEDYFAVITIPNTFTEYINSASEKDKKVATITYSPNQKYNYLASQIINKIVVAAENELQNQISETVVSTLSESLESVPESLEEINNGTDQLLDGADALSDGLNQINDGVTTLKDSYTEFDNGVESAYTGSQTLTSGIAQVNAGVTALDSGAGELDSAVAQINDGATTLTKQAGTGMNTLVSGLNELATGSNQLASQTPTLASGAASLATGASNLDAGVTQYVNTVNGSVSNIINTLTLAVQADPTLLNNPYIAGLLTTDVSGLSSAGENLKAGASSLNTNMASLSSGVSAVNDAVVNGLNPGINQLASTETATSLNQLVTGIGTLQNYLAQVKLGTTELKTGIDTLSTGASQLQTGSQTLTDGLGTLNTASAQVETALDTLNNGTQSAYDGSLALRDGIQELKDGVSDGITEANEQLEKLDGLSDFVRNSVEVEEVDYGEVSEYGVAFTPMFISVGLWVGSLMAYVVFYYDQDKRFKILGKFADNKFIQIVFYLGIAVIQGLLTAFLLDLGLDMDIQNYGLYYGSCVLIAITFMSLIQFFIMNFGEVGKFIALLVLVLQLASSGGTFPVALIDEGFQKLNSYLPMTYTIKLTKEAVIMQREGAAGNNIKIMMLYILIPLAITVIVEVIKKYYAKRKQKYREGEF